MASLIPRAALLPRRIPIGTSAATSQCTSPAVSRLFSSTPSAQAQSIPPESPFFINVPNPPQDQSIEARRELKRVRGFIPVPRRIFAHRDSHLKAKKAWVEAAAPLPSKEKLETKPASELQAWRRRMADKRRENMREGIVALWDRKRRADSKRSAARAAKLEENLAAARAPEREDERLTRGSIHPATLVTAVLPDPERFTRARESAERTAAIIARKSEDRCDALKTLYMNARSFIVDEADLEATVQKVFADDYFESKGSGPTGYRVENVWDDEGAPMSLEGMLKSLQRSTSSLVVEEQSTHTSRTTRRQRLVAEELTGCKLDID